MQEDEGRRMLENLFNIQKTAFVIGKNPINIDMINNFDETTRRIDNYDNREYKNKIALLLTVSSNIEEECDRLAKLIVLINDRIEKRNTLAKEYNKATGKIIEGLQPIDGADDIFAYKQRYNNIKKYLDATTKSKTLEEDVKLLKENLEDKLKIAREDERKNKNLEIKLEEKFKEIYNEYLSINDIDKYNLDVKLEESKKDLEEALTSLNAFELAYNTIKYGVPAEELTKYNKDAYDFKVKYYNMKVKDIVTRIFKIIITKIEPRYENLILKRDNIKNVINELYLVKSKYMIYEENFFEELIYYINEQSEEVSTQEGNINEINKLKEKIAFKEEKIVDFKGYFEEYGVIKIMDEYIKNNKEKPLLEEVVVPTLEKYQDNEIISTSSIGDNMNIKEIKSKTDDVLKRVSELLGINKVDKKVEAPVFKPVMITPNVEEKVLETKKEDIFNNKSNDIFENDNIIKTNTNEIFFEMPTLPTNNASNIGKYDENEFPF